jgi:CBS domain-containing protein
MWASSGDLAKLRAHTAGEAMTAPALTIEPSQPVAEAARRMVDRGVNRLPVVEDGRLVGIVTRADLVRLFTRSDEEIARAIRRMSWAA